MFGGMNPKQLNALMKQMGIKQTQLPAEEVIIRGEKSYRIKNPNVMIIEAQGQKTFQIMGDLEEIETKQYNEEDVEMIMQQTRVSKEEAVKALEENDGDLAEAIMKLKEKEGEE